jgi:hypothetical protein
MGSPIRHQPWGHGDLMRELGADPKPFLTRFAISPGVEHQEDAFARMLEFSAADFGCLDFGLRLSRQAAVWNASDGSRRPSGAIPSMTTFERSL